MRYSTPCQGGAARQADDILHVGAAHDPGVVYRNVHEQLVQFDILLRSGGDEVVVLQAGYGEDRRTVQLRVVKAVQKMNAARSGGGEADSQLARELGIATGHEGGRFLMAHLDEADLLLLQPQGFNDSVDAMSPHAENRLRLPGPEPPDQPPRRG